MYIPLQVITQFVDFFPAQFTQVRGFLFGFFKGLLESRQCFFLSLMPGGFNRFAHFIVGLEQFFLGVGFHGVIPYNWVMIGKDDPSRKTRLQV